jgi:hypothetical protein
VRAIWSFSRVGVAHPPTHKYQHPRLSWTAKSNQTAGRFPVSRCWPLLGAGSPPMTVLWRINAASARGGQSWRDERITRIDKDGHCGGAPNSCVWGSIGLVGRHRFLGVVDGMVPNLPPDCTSISNIELARLISFVRMASTTYFRPCHSQIRKGTCKTFIFGHVNPVSDKFTVRN